LAIDFLITAAIPKGISGILRAIGTNGFSKIALTESIANLLLTSLTNLL
jgi:hypothetical protein